MGMYTGIRFKGIIKEEFRDIGFEEIAMEGLWRDSDIQKLRDFGHNYWRSSFIPCGCLSYMPDSWEYHNDDYEKYSWEWFDSARDADGFERSYDKNTGKWSFQCSLKNYEGEIEAFMKIIPIFVESIEHFEIYYEEWDESNVYDLIEGELQLNKSKSIRYV